MHASTDRLEFAPPHEPAAVRAFALAVIAHLLLMLALAWGINWQKETQDVAAEAELWSSIPEVPAPPQPQVVQAPPIVPRVEPPPVAKEPDIALEQERRRRQEEARLRDEQVEKERRLEAQRRREDAERQKQLEAKHKQEELRRERLAEQQAAEEQKRKEDLAKAVKAKQDQARLDKLRKENIDRMLAGAGSPVGGTPSGVAGGAGRSTSAGYGARVQARVRPYIVYPDDLPGNPEAEIEVKCAPDGTIVGTRVVKHSTSKQWDDAVLAALTKAQVLPRDIDGKVPTPLVIVFKRRP